MCWPKRESGPLLRTTNNTAPGQLNKELMPVDPLICLLLARRSESSEETGVKLSSAPEHRTADGADKDHNRPGYARVNLTGISDLFVTGLGTGANLEIKRRDRTTDDRSKRIKEKPDTPSRPTRQKQTRQTRLLCFQHLSRYFQKISQRLEGGQITRPWH